MILNKHSPRYRELLWLACRIEDSANPAHIGKVICNLCGLPVDVGSDWDESHSGTPHALGGNVVGIAHRRCNQRDNNENVTPMIAKAKRQRRKHLGIDRPGLGKAKLPCGKDSTKRKKLSGEVVNRVSQSSEHRRVMEARVIR